MARKAATMADVAKIANVTAMTVSRALRQDPSISLDTRRRIAEIAEDLGYVLDGSAATLKAGRSGFVATIVPTLNNSNFAETVQGLTDGLRPLRLQVLLGYTNYSKETEEEIITSLLVRRPEAIVITGSDHTERARRLLHGSGIPVVEMWDAPQAPIHHSVGFSNEQAGQLITRYLHEKGYRRIGFIGGTSDRDVRGAERRSGYETAIREIGGQSRVVAYGEPPMTMLQGAGALTSLLERWPDCDAVICVSDLIAFGVLEECRRRNIAVPGQLAIAGFGNYDVAICSVPSLTTVDVQARQIGLDVAALIGRALAKDQPPDAISIRHDPRVIAREST